MTAVKLGNHEFKVEAIRWDFKPKGIRDKYFNQTLEMIDVTKKMKWFCDGGRSEPPTFPTQFDAVEPHFLIYHNRTPWKTKRNQVDRDSAIAGQTFMRLAGFADEKALDDELLAKFGVQDIEFKVDPVIAKLKPKYRLKIEVKLEFKHFSLFNVKVVPGAVILLSLPHRVQISMEKTHECTPEGVVKIKNKRWLTTVESSLVRSKTKAAFSLRRMSEDKWIASNKKLLETAKARLEESQKKLDDMKPEAD